MGQKAPYKLPKLPPPQEKIETIKILKKANSASLAIAELKGIAQTIPNQTMLINAVVLKEAKDSSEIKNIITSTDELYEALTSKKTFSKPMLKKLLTTEDQFFLDLK